MPLNCLLYNILIAHSYESTLLMVTKGGIIQVKTIMIKKLFQEKVTFMVTFREKIVFVSFKRPYVNCSLADFKRVAISNEKLYSEQ